VCYPSNSTNFLETHDFEVQRAYPVVSSEGGPTIGNLEVKFTFIGRTIDPGYSGESTSTHQPGFALGYKENLSRVDAEELLKSTPLGTFLIRFSENTQTYVLSYVGKGGVVAHIGHIKAGAHGISVTTEKGTENYKDLHSFVETMKRLGVITSSIDEGSYLHIDQIKK